MDPFEFVLAIIVVIGVGRFVMRALEIRASQASARVKQGDADVQGMLRDLERMEARMENLETILLERVQRSPVEKL